VVRVCGRAGDVCPAAQGTSAEVTVAVEAEKKKKKKKKLQRREKHWKEKRKKATVAAWWPVGGRNGG
jgi:hypothetical protein